MMTTAVLSLCWNCDGRSAENDTTRLDPAQAAFFETRVQPILKARCLKCHGGEAKVRGNFRVDSRAAVLRGGDEGPAITLERPEESLLLQAIHYDGLEMPPAGKLPGAEIDVLTRWVKEGLAWPAADRPAAVPAATATSADAGKPSSRWAYGEVVRPALPAARNPSWVRNPIDALLLARLESAGLEPAPPAERVALIRRLTYDLTGLPPSPEEVDAFIADHAPDAYERLVDRLLASPHYGEAWGRHWLDLVRYAETNGYERDSAKPHAWRYRDYVIGAFNQDKPYDRFLHEQLAGDEIDPSSAEALIATGFYRLGLWDHEPVDFLLARFDGLDGIVSTAGQVFLGLSINCALPRPQEGPDSPGRLLPVPGLLQRCHQLGRTQHAAGRPRTWRRGHVCPRARPCRDPRPVARQPQAARPEGQAGRSGDAGPAHHDLHHGASLDSHAGGST